MTTLLHLLEVMQADIVPAKKRLERTERSRRQGRIGPKASLYPDTCGVPTDGVPEHHLPMSDGTYAIKEEDW